MVSKVKPRANAVKKAVKKTVIKSRTKKGGTMSTKNKFLTGLGAVGTLGAAGLLARYHLDSIARRNANIADKNIAIDFRNKKLEQEYNSKIGITGRLNNIISKYLRKTKDRIQTP